MIEHLTTGLQELYLPCGFEAQISGMFIETLAESPESKQNQLLERVIQAHREGKPVTVTAWSRAYQNLLPNANFFAFRPHRFETIFKTFGTSQVPFQQDHRLQQSLRGGKILDTKFEGDTSKEGAWVFFKVQAVKEWATIGLLDGTVDRFSMGANPGRNAGDVSCSIPWCEKSWTTDFCSHWPGAEYVGPEKTTWEGQSSRCFAWVGNKNLDAKAPATDASGREYSAVVNPAIPGTTVEVPEVKAHLAIMAARSGIELSSYGAQEAAVRDTLAILSRAGQVPDVQTRIYNAPTNVVSTKTEEKMTRTDLITGLTDAVTEDGDAFDPRAWAEEHIPEEHINSVADGLRAAFGAYAQAEVSDALETATEENEELLSEARSSETEATARADELEAEIRDQLITTTVAARSAAGSLTTDEAGDAELLGKCGLEELRRHRDSALSMSLPTPPAGSGTTSTETPETAAVRGTDIGLSEIELEALVSGDTTALSRLGRSFNTALDAQHR